MPETGLKIKADELVEPAQGAGSALEIDVPARHMLIEHHRRLAVFVARPLARVF